MLSEIIDANHPLVKLAESIDWESIEEDLSEAYPSVTGHPNKPIRLMVGLHYLRYMFNHSDESIIWAYIENPYYQYFCGEKVFRHSFPIDRSSMSQFRERLKKRPEAFCSTAGGFMSRPEAVKTSSTACMRARLPVSPRVKSTNATSSVTSPLSSRPPKSASSFMLKPMRAIPMTDTHYHRWSKRPMKALKS